MSGNINAFLWPPNVVLVAPYIIFFHHYSYTRTDDDMMAAWQDSRFKSGCQCIVIIRHTELRPGRRPCTNRRAALVRLRHNFECPWLEQCMGKHPESILKHVQGHNWENEKHKAWIDAAILSKTSPLVYSWDCFTMLYTIIMSQKHVTIAINLLTSQKHITVTVGNKWLAIVKSIWNPRIGGWTVSDFVMLNVSRFHNIVQCTLHTARWRDNALLTIS